MFEGARLIRSACALCLLGIGLAAHAGETVHITDGGRLVLELRADYLADFGIAIAGGDRGADGRVEAATVVFDGLVVAITPGQFGGFISGQAHARTDLVMQHGHETLRLTSLTLVPAEDGRRPAIEMHGRDGTHLFTLTHLHTMLRPEAGRIEIRHGDVVAEAGLARAMGFSDLDGMVVGGAWLDLEIAESRSGDRERLAAADGARELSCDNRPAWPQEGHQVDVALTGMDQVQYQGTSDGLVKLAPSATLENVSEGDVPWIAKFESDPDYTYEPEDQHPYLVWSLYRLHEGRIEQLGISGVKHAFNTINQNCDIECSYLNGNTLGPGCEDVYSVNTNDENGLMGPREEVEASLGHFESSPSFFDPDEDGEQENDSGEFENRLLVEADDLDMTGAEYFVAAWYVIQCDGNIWNSMGYRQVAPEQGEFGGWTFPTVGGFRQGPALSEWTGEGLSTWSAHSVAVVPSLTPEAGCPEGMPQGHARVLVRVAPEPGGGYRYRYAVQNFDIDRGIDRVTIPLAEGADFSASAVTGPENAAQWSGSAVANEIVFEGGSGEIMPWMALYNFEFVSSASPAKGTLRLGLGESEQPSEQEVETIVPGNGLIYSDRFIEPALAWLYR
ncbi:MAG: hypothetical protein ACOCSR_03605 [Wenzhouxiangella sp.]